MKTIEKNTLKKVSSLKKKMMIHSKRDKNLVWLHNRKTDDANKTDINANRFEVVKVGFHISKGLEFMINY